MRMRLRWDNIIVAEGAVRDELIDAGSTERKVLAFSRPADVRISREHFEAIATDEGMTLSGPATYWAVELIPDYMDLPGTEGAQ